jgi:hypothetical protein
MDVAPVDEEIVWYLVEPGLRLTSFPQPHEIPAAAAVDFKH